MVYILNVMELLPGTRIGYCFQKMNAHALDDCQKTVAQRMRDQGYAEFVLPECLHDADLDAQSWQVFADSWERLPRDTYMADGGHYRQRRFSILRAQALDESASLAPHGPHYQAREYNSLNGGVARHYLPVETSIVHNPWFYKPLNYVLDEVRELKPGFDWHIEVHQFRILAQAGVPGLPTPEGIHRDGVDFVFIGLIRRENIQGGLSRIYDEDRQLLRECTLDGPLHSLLLDDATLYHEVTPVLPADSERSAWRDVLVITFRRC
jgi:hypothetical protein